MSNLELRQPAEAQINGRTGSKLYVLDPSLKLVVFFDPDIMDPDYAADFIARHPNAVLYAVKVPAGKTLDDAIRLFIDKAELPKVFPT